VKPVVFSWKAERDLDDIAEHIAADNPRRCFALRTLPESARSFPELGPDAHILPFRNYVILYRNLPRHVSIERVLHAARDIVATISRED
jgi:plasmid stabilization system protein ParE